MKTMQLMPRENKFRVSKIGDCQLLHFEAWRKVKSLRFEKGVKFCSVSRVNVSTYAFIFLCKNYVGNCARLIRLTFVKLVGARRASYPWYMEDANLVTPELKSIPPKHHTTPPPSCFLYTNSPYWSPYVSLTTN